MNILQAATLMLCGALTLALAYGIVVGVRKISRAFTELVAGLKAVGSVAETNRQLVEVAKSVALEISILRTLLASNSPSETTYSPSTEGEAGPTRPKPGRPFPSPNYEMFRSEPVPDADEKDTVIDNTEDKDMVRLEQVEETIGRGFEPDDAE